MFSEIRPKSCTYGCGIEIYWNTEENTYYELYSKKKHIYPNIATYNKESAIIPPTTAANPTYHNKEFPNSNQATTTTTRIKSKMDNSFEFLQGSPDTIKKQYEFVSDIIRDCNGKVHGSQSHISNNSMYLIVYYEVPEGQRDDVNKKIDNFSQYKSEMACSRIR
ncbi:MAG: hypothetical protein ACXWE7_13925 [Nitrososphaeraceae archaeon]